MESRISPSVPITELLRMTREGDSEAEEYLFRIIFGQLRRVAAARLRKERGRAELEPTELVNEAYLHLFGDQGRVFSNRTHFLAVAARAMHCILIDMARKRRSERHGGGFQKVTLNSWISGEKGNWSDRLLVLEDLLQRLAKFDEQAARIVEMKVFVGSTDEEIADVIGKCSRSVKRDYRAAKAWLMAELGGPRLAAGAAGGGV